MCDIAEILPQTSLTSSRDPRVCFPLGRTRRLQGPRNQLLVHLQGKSRYCRSPDGLLSKIHVEGRLEETNHLIVLQID